MYYKYLDREQLYLRSYRTHNLWLDQYHKNMRQPRVVGFHINLFKRIAKSYSGVRVMANLWGFTFVSGLIFLTRFSKTESVDPKQNEVYMRLNSIFAKNKYGYNTRFMSDFDLLLDSMLNERFIDESTMYYDNVIKEKEIYDMEQGLAGDFVEDDIKDLLKDKHAHGSHFKSLKYPGRVGSNYTGAQADMSCYKVHPSGSKPAF